MASAPPKPRSGPTRRPLRGGLPPGSRLPAPAQTFLFWRWPLAYFERARDRHGSRFTLRATGHPPFAFVADPDGLRALFKAPSDVLHPGEGGSAIQPLIGDRSFMLLDGEEHSSGRRAIMPAFHEQVVQRHVGVVADIARREVATWPRGRPFALHPRLHAMTLEIILRTVFESVMDERLCALHERLLSMLSITAGVVLSEPVLRRGPGGVLWRRFLRQREEVDELIFVLLDERHRALEGERGRANGPGERGRECPPEGCLGAGGPANRGDMLGRLLTTRNPDGSRMSRRQVRDNVLTIIVAGHETTASELEWAFQLLAHNPTVLRRLVGEIDGGGGEEYLTATIHEVLRHRPAFLFMIPRAVKHPFEIDGWTYRAPTHLLGCIYLVHHDPLLYPEPEQFRPERFLSAPPGAHTWLPWGGGRRRCPGRHMAMLQMKTVLRTVLSAVTVHPAAKSIEQARWRSVVVTPHAGSRVVLRSRNGA
jgi:cytochrome P450